MPLTLPLQLLFFSSEETPVTQTVRRELFTDKTPDEPSSNPQQETEKIRSLASLPQKRSILFTASIIYY